MSEVPSEARTVPQMTTELEHAPLQERSSGDPCFEKIYPFESDLKLREEYINFFGGLRIGKLLEDLDLVAGKLLMPMPRAGREDWELLPPHVTVLI